MQELLAEVLCNTLTAGQEDRITEMMMQNEMAKMPMAMNSRG